MNEILTNLSSYGYIVLFLYSLGGGFLALVGAGVLSYMGKMDLSISLLVAFSANFLGDTLLFYMSRYHKSEMMEYLKKHRRKVAFSHILLKRHGNWIIVFKKFIYGLKTLVPLAVGLTKYNFWTFSLYNVLGAAIWSVSFGVGSYLFGSTLMHAYELIAQKPYLAPISLLVMGGLLWLYLSQATKKKEK